MTPPSYPAPVGEPAQAPRPERVAGSQGYSPGYGAAAPQASFYAVPPVRSPLQWRAHVRARFDAGNSPAQMLDEMAASGMTQQTAFGIVAEARGEMRARAIKVMAGGVISAFLLLALMFAITVEAGPFGRGTYIFWFGPVIFGSAAVAYGLYLLARVPRSPF